MISLVTADKRFKIKVELTHALDNKNQHTSVSRKQIALFLLNQYKLRSIATALYIKS